jgi:hypothetical protein
VIKILSEKDMSDTFVVIPAMEAAAALVGAGKGDVTVISSIFDSNNRPIGF